MINDLLNPAPAVPWLVLAGGQQVGEVQAKDAYGAARAACAAYPSLRELKVVPKPAPE